ncbi:hypothetical protein ABL78_6750 [Leptomonas seymouri]|uniref:TatD related DNase n=1 Tax=Leptomonas seymouri TaxID=5684 RepID=A0A0N1I0E3_LEPSE|nr:hypothetical protein ABL78_6750 [Leptomonas seymouri]|eukprot:KPI84192.1 hypothetical protein ABL78_6750 [Leptomonas seymouri]
MGFVDRGGGREAKGTSLRHSKKNPGAPSARSKASRNIHAAPTKRATPIPPAACAPFIESLAAVGAVGADAAAAAAPTFEDMWKTVCESVTMETPLHIDAAVALLSRKLEDDREGIFRRAVEEGRLAGALCWSNEVEKQAVLLDTCVQHNRLFRGAADAASASSSAAATRHVRFQDESLAASPVPTTGGGTPLSAKGGILLYAILGIHVNSVDRVHMRLHEQWIKDLEENVKHGDVVGVLSGLNLSRDHGTHYAQERLLRECWRVAAEVRLPLLLHLYAADAATLTDTANRGAELIQELLHSGGSDAAAPTAVVLYNGLAALHASLAMQQLVRTHRPGAAAATATTAEGESAAAKQHAPSATPFYVLATAEGLVERPAVAADEEVNGRACGSASVESLASLLPPRELDHSGSSSDAVLLLSQLLIGTGAPWATPQNLPDPHLCTLPNEPGNYPYVVKTVFDAMKTPSAGGGAAGATLASADQLAAYVHLNQLRVFFRECIEGAQRGEGAAHSEADSAGNVDADAHQQRRWTESQQPAAATAVAGLTDDEAKRDLEAVLAEAAKERERVEEERLREEAERAQARSRELQEKRSKHAKKKNVKANNRSNFTHFRNKDFAPRQRKPGHQPALDGAEEVDSGDDRGDEGAEAGAGSPHRRTSSSCSGSHSDSGDEAAVEGDVRNRHNVAAAAAGSLAAEVEALLREAERRHPASGRAGERGRGSTKEAAKSASAAPAPTAAKGRGKTQANQPKAQRASGESAGDSGDSSRSDAGSDGADAAVAYTQPSRRLRKRQQKRQQQMMREDDSDDA